MSRKEHLLLYTADVAVLPKVINSLRPERQEIHELWGAAGLGCQLTAVVCKQVWITPAKCSSHRNPLSTGAKMPFSWADFEKRGMSYRNLANARYYKYYPLVLYLIIDCFIQ